MRLRELLLTRYRQFIDEKLGLDPYVTVIVGRNDTGKTGVLDHFFDQCVYEVAIAGADRPLVPGYEAALTAFSMRWEIVPDDYAAMALPAELGPVGSHRLDVSFQDLDRPGRYWQHRLDDREIDLYEGVTREGMPILPDRFRPRHIFPTPRYISVAQLIRMQFEMRPWGLEPGAIELPVRRPGPETALLRLAGIRARTRDVVGIDRPWEGPLLPPSPLTPKEINERLAAVARRITQHLQTWWHDPAGLVFDARLAGDWSGEAATRAMTGHAIPTLLVTCEIHDRDGIPYHGTGLLWFITFLIEWLGIEEAAQPLLLLFDEPATPLHPSAQRVAAKLLASVASRHQVIYTTHSPFMVDWDFPQRIRMFVRDPKTKRTHINNKPYHPREGVRHIWDPLRATIGVTLGDVAIVSEKNVLVEGVTDQILVANASALLKERGEPHLDPKITSIIPYSDLANLEHLLGVAATHRTKAIVLADSDQQGRRVADRCRREGIPQVGIGQFADRDSTDCAIEDVIGIDVYVAEVNAAYREFEWFRPFEMNVVRAGIGQLSLGRYLQQLFEEQFGRNFDKTGVTVSLAGRLAELPNPVLERLSKLVTALGEALN